MNLACPDAVNVDALPDGFPAYLGYTDGEFPTADALRAKFPAADLILLTVTGDTAAAHGARVAPGTDTEPSDLTAASAAHWVSAHAELGSRPVMYASVAGAPGYGMRDVLTELTGLGIGRSEVRLLSAHYGAGSHICGPRSCGQIQVEMDGTQWTDDARGIGGATIDMSLLTGDFFARQATQTEVLVQELGTVRQGMTGAPVETVQGLLVARGRIHVAVDGIFGPDTAQQVKVIQHNAGISEDGIVGPQTWPVLLGVA